MGANPTAIEIFIQLEIHKNNPPPQTAQAPHLDL
jgi:hypothetical protein